MSGSNGKTRQAPVGAPILGPLEPLETGQLVHRTLSHCRDPQQLAEVIGQLHLHLESWEKARTAAHVTRLLRSGK